MKKIIFLDIDGVMNNCGQDSAARTPADPELGIIGVDPKFVAILNRIVEATGATIILSSTWRQGKKSRAYLLKKGIKFAGITPRLPGEPRGKEIAAFLAEHPKNRRYAILDDDTDMLPEQMRSFFHVKGSTGLTDELADRVIKHLRTAPAVIRCKECQFEDGEHALTCTQWVPKFPPGYKPAPEGEEIGADGGDFEPLRRLICGPGPCVGKPKELYRAMLVLIRQTGDAVAEQAHELGRKDAVMLYSDAIRASYKMAVRECSRKIRTGIARIIAPRDIIFLKRTEIIAAFLHEEKRRPAYEHGEKNSNTIDGKEERAHDAETRQAAPK